MEFKLLTFNQILIKIINKKLISKEIIHLETGLEIRRINRYLQQENEINYETAIKIINCFRNHQINIYDFIFNQKKEDNIYYHGSKSTIKGDIRCDVNDSDKHDFGNGFYMGESFMQSSTLVSSYEFNNGTIYKIKYSDNGLLVKTTSIAPPNYDWFLYIAYNRKYLENLNSANKIKYIMSKYDKGENNEPIDVIVGPIADDSLYYSSIKFFANEITTHQLELNLKRLALGNQYCFKTPKSCKCLEILEAIKLDNTMFRLIKSFSEQQRDEAANFAHDSENYKKTGEKFKDLLARFK